MADISKIEHSGQLYTIKDTVARSLANPSTSGATAGDVLCKSATDNAWVHPSSLTVGSVAHSLTITSPDGTDTFNGSADVAVTISAFTAAEVDTIFDGVA